MNTNSNSGFSTELAQARAHHQEGRLAEAQRGYLALLQSSPEHPQLLYLAGMVALQLGDLNKARPWLERAVSRAQSDSRVWTGLGQLEEISHNWIQALSCYDKSLQFAPNLTFVNHHRAYVTEMSGDVESASIRYRRALEISFADTPVENHSRFRNIYHCCTQKTASQWLRGIFSDSDFYRSTGMLMQPYVQLGLNKAQLENEWPADTIATHLYINFDTFSAMPKPGEYKAFFILRDPRDCVVSWYHSARYSHNTVHPIGWLREQLNARSENEGFQFMIDWMNEVGFFEAQRSWVRAEQTHSNVRVYRYEDLNLTPREFLDDLFDYLEVPLNPVARDALCDRHAWEKLSGGRSKGENDPNSHYRKAKIGDWKSYFSGPIYSHFLITTGDLTSVLGYKA